MKAKYEIDSSNEDFYTGQESNKAERGLVRSFTKQQKEAADNLIGSLVSVDYSLPTGINQQR